MDRDDRQNDRILSVDKDTQINVVVNNPDDDNTINLGRVLHNVKLKRRVYAWVLLLCMVAGICASLLLYQLTKPPLVVSSVVTLAYGVDDLSAPEAPQDPDSLEETPEKTPLDLNQITSSYVLQTALSGLELSHPITLSDLRSNIRIDRILTEDSRRQQEVAASMIEDKNNQAYTQVQGIELTYDNRFVVSLTNGFGDEDSRVKYELTDAELRLILNRILDAYNDYLFTTYADAKLPDDEISVIDTQGLDILESLDLLRSAVDDLYDYCDEKPDEIKEYRSWRTGRSLNDLMKDLRRVKSVNVDYLYSYVFANSIVRDRKAMITNYQYQLRNAQTELDVVNENITTTKTILDSYKNDEIFVSMQESDTSKSTKTTTDYYNNLVLQQTENYEKAARLEITISDLQEKINSLVATEQASDTADVNDELERAMTLCHAAYKQVYAQMQEITTSVFYTTYAEHSVAQGKSKSFITAASKKMIIGAIGGLVIACGLWFLSALAPEFHRKGKEEEAAKEATER